MIAFSGLNADFLPSRTCVTHTHRKKQQENYWGNINLLFSKRKRERKKKSKRAKSDSAVQYSSMCVRDLVTSLPCFLRRIISSSDPAGWRCKEGDIYANIYSPMMRRGGRRLGTNSYRSCYILSYEDGQHTKGKNNKSVFKLRLNCFRK